ncbi:MAG: FAD-dependent oxidoreductase [Synergistaceae bacterium]|jgi:hypothetical protein|nr:FAD-dependent oxidoreductase [Synergistaceae bacterium]
MTRQYEQYDVIIVGGGLAGLSAACEVSLNVKTGKPRKKVLLLEADGRLGGKVRTGKRDRIVYETGSIFAFNPKWFDFPVDAGSHYENDNPVGLFHRGRLHTGDSVVDCVRSLNSAPRQQICLSSFLASPNPQEAMIGEDLGAAMKAFFRVIHPGTPTEAVPTRRRDCLLRHRADYFQRGNGAMIQAMAANLTAASGGAEIRTACRVYELVPKKDSQESEALERGLSVGGQSSKSVKVLWRNGNGAKEEAVAQKIILAVPATEAKKLCSEFKNVSSDFLGRVRYGGGIAVVLHCRVENRRALSYLVSTQGHFNTFIFHQLPGVSGVSNENEVVVTGYIVGESMAASEGMSDADLTRMMIEELQATSVGEFTVKNCSLLESRRWAEVGPIIEESTYRGFSATWLCPMPGVVLAGDYTEWDGAALPYGMWPAIASGRRAAAFCLKDDFGPISVDFGRMPLAETTVLRMGGNGPQLTETFRDGTVAYYGLLLQAEKAGKGETSFLEGESWETERYLLEEAVDGLWGYQRDYGVTSLDSALVMEGLLSTGRHRTCLRESCRRLVDVFFDREQGGFGTLPADAPGRAPYWRGVDCPATAFCAWLLTRIDPERYAEEITLCRDYLLRNQQVSGGWPGKWFPSQTIPIWYALRFFTSLEGSPYDSQLLKEVEARAVYRLQSGQGNEGAWGGSVIETSAALLALTVASPSSSSLDPGRDWLRRIKGPGGWAGEPILAYWFEEDGERTLFFTRDLGGVSSAWATLALMDGKAKS